MIDSRYQSELRIRPPEVLKWADFRTDQIIHKPFISIENMESSGMSVWKEGDFGERHTGNHIFLFPSSITSHTCQGVSKMYSHFIIGARVISAGRINSTCKFLCFITLISSFLPVS